MIDTLSLTREELYELVETSVEELIQYCKDVIDDEIISCQKHKWACMRFLKDLEHQGTKEFPYIFDIERANRYLHWMTYFKHTKSKLAGQYKIPEPIEKFIFANVYGWVHKDTKLRRFRRAYWQVARKNAKSQNLAILALYELAAMGEKSSEVYIAATKKDQTRYVWGEAKNMAEMCEFLKDKIKCKFYDDIGQKVLLHEKSKSFFARMTEEDRKKGDGSNPHCGILDEYHAHPTTEYYDVLSSGMKLREQPLLMIITTAGFNLNYPCYREYQYASKILNPDIDTEDDEYFIMINELDVDENGELIDDFRDERVWIKANPIAAKTEEGIKNIKDELKVALNKPDKMRDFLTRTMNVWVNQRTFGYMNMSKWKACGASKDNPFPDLTGRKGVIGVDLTSKLDLASVAFEFPLDDGRIAVLSHSFMPEATYFMRLAKDKKTHFDSWVKEGWLTITPEEVIDDDFIAEYIEEQRKKNQWELKMLGFDIYNATSFANKMAKEYGYEVIEVRQGVLSLHEPTKDFRERVYAKKIIHNNNPVLNWAMGNAVIKDSRNAQANIMLSKGESFDNIDPIAALIDAHYIVLRKNPNNEDDCVYNHRGIITAF